MIEIKNLKDLRAQIGKPILLGYWNYPTESTFYIRNV